ncbi:COP9 signalosome complex subunit 8 [Heterostelium album PN500]|uniref:COP9 signalosome complex subunit 8 n=1 Tax=Heterostelium pallidum (strain ATCC 26659 / Pp 5 / PN500) TaxID=670386 RepID=D3BM89_HETP5|nr:COP9 signalosome complex subunit 8 [Heterostelium album PN500]EFA77690.1 COP9 signalosome complex subunit 8 [Heterostelium album PN500]|eukprot:XP_020429818.1 COP9 signalosome complex subunit 8 [Heterostelium album PN500]
MSSFPEIQKYIDERDFLNVLSWCQERELKSLDKPDSFKKYWGVYLIAYLIQNDIVNARFLWHRIPSEVKGADQHLKSIWSLLKHLSQLNYPHIYKSLSLNYGSELTPLITILKGILSIDESDHPPTKQMTNQSHFIFLRNIPKSSYLGISPEDTLTCMYADNNNNISNFLHHKQITVTQAQGWTKDTSSESLKPVPTKAKEHQVKSANHQINSLTNFVLFLEKEHNF